MTPKVKGKVTKHLPFTADIEKLKQPLLFLEVGHHTSNRLKVLISGVVISKIQRLQNKFMRLALRLPKYICSKLLHDSTGLPYVKDRLLSCAAKSLDRIAQNLWSGSQYLPTGSILLGAVSQRHYLWSVLYVLRIT